MEQGGGANVPHRERIVARIRRVERLVPQFLASILLFVYQLIVINVRVNSQT